jgi:hypothetical protein
MNRFVLAKDDPEQREHVYIALAGFLTKLPIVSAWEIIVGPYKKHRSDQQNRYLWGVIYPTITKTLHGWTADDVHEYMLGEWSGWETLEGLGRKRLRPIRRSSKLSTSEFAEFVGFIQQRMAEHGVYIPDPNT